MRAGRNALAGTPHCRAQASNKSKTTVRKLLGNEAVVPFDMHGVASEACGEELDGAASQKMSQ